MSSKNIHPTAIVDPNAKLGENVKIGAYSIIGPEVTIGNGTVVESHVVIEGETIIGENNYIFSFASIGKDPQDLKFAGEKTRVVIGNNNKIREFVTIHRGTTDKYETRVGNNTLVMAYVHIAHDCIIGDNCVLANYAVVGALTALHQFTRVGRHAMIGGCSAVNQDVVPYMLSEGNKARAVYINIVGLQRRGFSDEQIKRLRELYKIIFKKKLKLEEALQTVEREYGQYEEAQNLINFIRKSKRGITR